MSPQKAVVGAKAGKALPMIAGHFARQGALAMHGFVMRKRQNEALGVGIYHAEGHVVMVVAAMHRIMRHVAQGIVHPAHIPFVVKAQRSEEHTSKLQSLMRNSYAVF